MLFPSFSLCFTTHSIIDYDNDGQSISTAPIYNYLIDGHHGLDILVYSGDDDAVCSTLGSQKWVRRELMFTVIIGLLLFYYWLIIAPT